MNWSWMKYCSLADKHRKVYVVCMLVSSFFSNVLVGTLYTYGNMQPYLVSYIRLRSEPSTLRYTESTYLYSTVYAGHAIGCALGGLVEFKFGARLSYIVGAVLSTLGLLLSYLTIQYSYWLLFVTYGVMYSLGIGFIYFVTIKVATIWLPDRAGLAVGIVIGGAGLGGLVFGALESGFVNRHNYYPDYAPYPNNPDEKYYTRNDLIKHVPFMFLIQGVIFGVVNAIATCFIANPRPTTAYVALPNQDEKEPLIQQEPSINTIQQEPSISTIQQEPSINTIQQEPSINSVKHQPLSVVHQNNPKGRWHQMKQAFVALTTIQCYLLWMINMDCIMSTGVISSLYKTYGLEVLYTSDYFLTALGSVGYGVCSILGRVAFGYLGDRIGYEPTFITQTGIMAVFYCTLYTTSLGYSAMYFVWICAIFLCYGGHNTLFVLMMIKYFGNDHLFVNYTIMDTSSQLIAGFLFGFVSDLVDYLHWSGTFTLLGCTVTSQFFIVLILSNTKFTPPSAG